MKHIYQIKSILLWLAVFALCLIPAACSGGGTNSGTGNEPESETERLAADIRLTNAGAAGYIIVRPEAADKPDIVADAVSFVSQLNDQTGGGFRMTTDLLGFKESVDPEAFEILLGPTNRDESAEAAKTLGFGGYCVSTAGHKIVIYGNTADAQKKAEEAFLSALEKDESGETILKPDGNGIRFDGEKTHPVDGTVIACSQEIEKSVNDLVKTLKKNYSVRPEFIRTNEVKERPAIVIVEGDAAKAELGEAIGTQEYRLAVKGNKIVIAGGSSYALQCAITLFMHNYVEQPFALALAIPEQLYIKESLLGNLTYIERTTGTDLRIMSFNILCELWADAPIPGRDDTVAAVIQTYKPDVAGLCEVSDQWYDRLGKLIGTDYKFVNEKTKEKATNFSGMIYNHETVKLIESGCELFSQGNSRQLRLMNWGLFEKLDGGERFIVMNTHWDINNSSGVWNAYRLVQSKEMGERVVSLHEKYQCPVIATGDYNAVRAFEEFEQYEKISGTKDAMVTADKIINGDYRTIHTLGAFPVKFPEGVIDPRSFTGQLSASVIEGYLRTGKTLTYPDINAIDHITYTTDMHALLCHNVVEETVNACSDHTPVYADFSFVKK